MTKKQNELWEELYKRFRNNRYTNKFSISKPDIIAFLLDKTPDSLDTRHFEHWSEDLSSMSFKQKSALIQAEPDSWDLDSFYNIHNGMIVNSKLNHQFINYKQFKLIKDEIKGEITVLFDALMQQISQKNNVNNEPAYQSYSVNQKLQALVLYSVFGSITPVLFDTRNIMNKLNICRHYKERPSTDSKIKTYLTEKNILILKGSSGMGKTQTAIAYLQSASYDEILYLTTETASLKKLFHTTDKIIIKDKILLEKALAEKTESSLIFIDIPFLSDKDVQYLKQYFYGKKVRILITTCQVPFNSVDKCISCLEIGALDKQVLWDLFYTILGSGINNPFFTEEEFSVLLDIIDSNTLVVTMLAKMLRQYVNNKKPAPEELENLHHNLLDPQMWIWGSPPTVKIKNLAYTKNKSGKSFLYYIYGLLDKFNISYDSNVVEIALWTRNEIPVQALKAWGSEDIVESIQQANDYGLIEYGDIKRQHIIIRPFISDLLWHLVSDKVTILSYKENITKFLKYLELGKGSEFSYKTLYDAATNLCLRLRQELIERPKREFRIKDWRDYWEISRKIAGFFIQTGNINQAAELFSDLYYFDAAIKTGVDTKNTSKLPGINIRKIETQLLNGHDIRKYLEEIKEELLSTDYTYWRYEWISLICMICDIAIEMLNKIILMYLTDVEKPKVNARQLYDEVNELYTFLQTACKTEVDCNKYNWLLICYRGTFDYIGTFFCPEDVISKWNNARSSIKSAMFKCSQYSLNTKARCIYSFYEGLMLCRNHPDYMLEYLENPIVLKEILPDENVTGQSYLLESYDIKLWRMRAGLIIASINGAVSELMELQKHMDVFYQDQLKTEMSFYQEHHQAFDKIINDLKTINPKT